MKPLRHFATSPLRHFATSPLRHASHLVTLVLLALASTTANAALIVNVEGVRGSGKTTWTLSGSSGIARNGTIRTSEGSHTFSASDTGLFNSLLSKKLTFDNSLFAVRDGSATITVGSTTQTITHISLHRQPFPRSALVKAFNGLGIRVNSALSYTLPGGDLAEVRPRSRWSGRFTLDLDISNFNPGTYRIPFRKVGFNFSHAEILQRDVTLNIREVPEPSGLALLSLALASLGFSRKLVSVRAKA